MEKKLRVDMFNMTIVHYEDGNMKSYNRGIAGIRPVCALMLTDPQAKHKAKVLFKHDHAVAISNYIRTKHMLGKSFNETINIKGKVREFRKDHVLIDDVEYITVNLTLELAKC